MATSISSILSHKGPRYILLGWTFFISENLLLSENRDFIISKITEKNYHSLYNTLSAASCGSILYGYFRYGRQGPRLANFGLVGRSGIIRVLLVGVQALGMAGIISMLPKLQVPFALSFSSADAKNASVVEVDATQSPGEIKTSVAVQDASTDNSSTGIPSVKLLCPIDFSHKKDSSVLTKITRHPQLFSLAFATLPIALTSPLASHLILFGFPSVFTLVGGMHLDHRYLKSGRLSQEEYEKTSLLPFVALIQGKQKWSEVWDGLKGLNVMIGLGLGAGIGIRREIVLRRMLRK